MRQGSPKLVAGIGILLLLVLVFFFLNPPIPGVKEQENTPRSVADAIESTTGKHNDRVIVGGVERPATDVQLRSPEGGPERPTPKKPEGAPPIVRADTNPQVAMVSEALKSHTHPERLSSFVVPASFDKDAFDANPSQYAKAYSETVEPGRAFVTAQPKEGVAALRSVGPRMHRVVQGESVRLIVAAAAGAVVTFTSFGMGQFENSLTSITVVAADDGKATAVFTASSGTKNEVNIIAASPLLTEQVRFTVSVRLKPKSTAS